MAGSAATRGRLGMVYGVLVYLIMTFVVVPLSAIGFRPPRSLILMLTSLAVHVFAFGLPISLVVSTLLGARFRSQSPQTPTAPELRWAVMLRLSLTRRTMPA